MARGSCLLSLADICIWLAVIGSITALFAPFWLSIGDPPSRSDGLFMSCNDPYGKGGDPTCTFHTVDINSREKWFTSCQGLWAGGTALLFVIGIASFFLCCDACRRASCSGLVFVGTLIAALALCVTVILFGIKEADLGYELKRGSVYFDWGFYIAIISAATSLIAALLFGFVICCLRKE